MKHHARKFSWPLAAALALCLTAGCERGGDAPRETLERPAPEVAQAPEEPAPTLEEPEQKERDPLGPGTEEQQQLLVRAKAAYLNNQLSRAEPIFRQLAESSPVSSPQVSAAIALGDIYTATNRESKALELYGRLLERTGPLPEVYLVLGRTHVKQGRTEEAIAAYEKALEAQPLYLFLYVELGQLHAQRGDNEKSARALLEYERKVYALAKEVKDFENTPLEERLNIIDVFSLIEDDKGTQTLLEVLARDPDFEARAAAARTLGEVRAVSARPALEAVLANDASDEVRAAARASLKKLEGIEEPGVDDVTGPTFVQDGAKTP